MSHPLEEEFYYDEDQEKAQNLRKEENEALCHAKAVMLLEHLDPYVFAVQASAYGVVIYPRTHTSKLTTWEETLLKTELPIPAEWIGGLAHIDQELKANSKKSSVTSGTLWNKLLARAASERAQAVAFSLTRFNQRMQEFSLGGRTSETRSTQAVSPSISKAASGAKRWRRSEKPSS
jgi:hypothetical protein